MNHPNRDNQSERQAFFDGPAVSAHVLARPLS